MRRVTCAALVATMVGALWTGACGAASGIPAGLSVYMPLEEGRIVAHPATA